MAFNFSPVFNGWQFFTPSGLPLSGGFLNTYLAGTSTPANTYTTSVGNIANSNPIALLSDGRVPQEIWLDSTLAYKFVLTDSLLNQIGTYDNIVGIDNSVPAALTEWVLYAPAPSYVNATTFTLAGNQTALFEVGRRVRYTLNSGQFTGSIVTSVFGAITTVTLVTDSIPLDATLSAVAYGFLDALKSSVPTNFVSPITGASIAVIGAVSGATVAASAGATVGTTLSVGTTSTAALQPSFAASQTSNFNIGQSLTFADVIYTTEDYDNGNCYNNATGVFTAPVAGRYQVNFLIAPFFAAGSAVSTDMLVRLLKNGVTSLVNLRQQKTVAGAVTQTGPSLSYSNVVKLSANDTLKWQAYYSDAVSILCIANSALFSAELLG